MSKKRICLKCSKELTTPQSLWNHKQRCKVVKEGDGLMFPPAFNGVVATRKIITGWAKTKGAKLKFRYNQKYVTVLPTVRTRVTPTIALYMVQIRAL